MLRARTGGAECASSRRARASARGSGAPTLPSPLEGARAAVVVRGLCAAPPCGAAPTPINAEEAVAARSAGGTPARSTGVTPARSAGGTAARSAGGTAARSAGGTPARSAGGTPARTAGATPARVAGGTPARVAGGTSARTAGGTPARSAAVAGVAPAAAECCPLQCGAPPALATPGRPPAVVRGCRAWPHVRAPPWRAAAPFACAWAL